MRLLSVNAVRPGVLFEWGCMNRESMLMREVRRLHMEVGQIP